MKKLLFSLSLWALSAAADYGEQPLRGNLTDKPFGQTEGGRDDHRFASSPVNQYRIYDFYARQARWHLEHPEDKSELLLPYTGLDGGRRGHWGVTNEPAITALKRDTEPIYGSLTERGFGQVLALRSGSVAHPALILFGLDGKLQQVLLDGRIHAPGNAMMRHKVDIYGFDIRHEGRSYLQNAEPEWRLAEQAKTACRLDGRYLHGEQVVFSLALGDTHLLDLPLLSYDGETAVLQRHFESPQASPALLLQLPRGTKPGKAAATVAAGPQDSQLISVPQEKEWICHLVWSDEKAVKIDFQAPAQNLKISGLAAGTYAGLVSKINLAEPRKSHLYGMVSTKSMPPYPMPTVAPAMQQALLEWIAKGAPEK